MQSELKFIADENFDKEIVLALCEEYDVTYVAEFMPGSDDEEFLANAEKEQRIVHTSDKDFGDLVFRQSKAHAGVILCRIEALPREEKSNLIVSTIMKYGDDLLKAFTVIQPKNIRIRKL